MATYDPIEITKLFVFGTNDPSSDDYNLHIRPAVTDPDPEGVPIHYAMDTFMTVGGGRYANPALFSVIKEFFTKDTIPPGIYTEDGIINVLELDSTQVKITNISQYTTDIGNTDHAERSYIFGNSRFEIKFPSETRFVVENDNGVRTINGEMEIVALTDNFDFNSQAASYTQLVNDYLLEPTFDPYGLGRGKSPIIFDGQGKIYSVYGESDFIADQASASVVNSVPISEGIISLTLNDGIPYFNNILSDTFLSYQLGDKKVIYGTPADDTLDRTNAELSISKFLLNSYLIAGGDGNDSITGWDSSDHLTGGEGDDTLIGGKSFDRLEGGAGSDTYIINPGDGFDTILDTDGVGVIQFGNVAAEGRTGVIDGADWIKIGNSWTDQQNGLIYLLSPQANGTNDLLVSFVSDGGSARAVIKAWNDGELGITLGGNTPPDTPAFDRTILGDLQPEDLDDEADGVQTGFDELGNIIVGEDAEPDREDTLFGSAGNDLIQSFGGDDYVDSKAGEDRIEGGSGQDELRGGVGDDIVLGGTDNDIISGNEDDDLLYAETEYSNSRDTLFN